VATLHDVPLFPLGTVLFPGGKLPLKIFEQRYMDMAKVCLKDDSPFGVCLIASGRETGAPALPRLVGTLARIVNWDMPQLGVLQVECRGEQRFRIITRRVESSGLLRADIELSETEPAMAVPAEHGFLADLLARIIDQIEDATSLQPYRLDDAVWVAYRLSELLPMHSPIRQHLLELDSCGARFDVLHQLLLDQGLIKPSR
jgi:uncharacterized protein